MLRNAIEFCAITIKLASLIVIAHTIPLKSEIHSSWFVWGNKSITLESGIYQHLKEVSSVHVQRITLHLSVIRAFQILHRNGDSLQNSFFTYEYSSYSYMAWHNQKSIRTEDWLFSIIICSTWNFQFSIEIAPCDTWTSIDDVKRAFHKEC